MVTDAKRRDELRPSGLVSPECSSCQWKRECGGYFSGKLFGTCFDETCCEFVGKDKAHCNAVCPYNGDFNDWLADTKGLRFNDLPEFVQPPVRLPLYVPVVDHASRRAGPLQWPLVALDTYKVIRLRRGRDRRYTTVADDPAGLRRAFMLAPETKVMLRGVACDADLERYWEHREEAGAARQLAGLDVHAAIGPNFSHFLDVPRTDHLFNRRRQLLCLADFQTAGLPTIPHLNAVMPGDWQFWRRFLQANPSINTVAIELQTGNKNRKQGRKALDHLAATQRDVGRQLHPILIGGAQFVELAAVRFSHFTLVDSVPFIKAMHRRRFDASNARRPWREGFTLDTQPLDEFLFDNIAGYSHWLEQRASRARNDATLN